jgi:RNA polymerase sigma factor (sigma-70 family)
MKRDFPGRQCHWRPCKKAVGFSAPADILAELWHYLTTAPCCARGAARRSEAAFRTLVERYAGLVHGTALRQLRRANWAAEAAQDVFVLLARKAPRLTGAALGAWLHRAAIFTAAALLRKEARHARRVSQWAGEQLITGGDAAPSGPELDAALNALSETDRSLLVLRYFENRTASEAAQRLGLTAEAAQKRTERALQRLAGIMQRRGAAVVPAAIAGGLTAQFSHAAPANFTAAAVPHILAAPAAAGGISFFVYTLTTMKASHAAALTALLALVPVTILSVQNHRLQDDLAAKTAPGRANSLTVPPRAGEHAKVSGSTPAPRTASAPEAREVNWDELGEDDKVTVELSRDTILRSDLPALANYTNLTLSDGVRELLRISDPEASRVETALRNCEAELKKIERQKIKRIEDLPNGVVFEIPAFAEEAKPLRDQLFAEVTAAVGERRAGFLLPKIAQTTDWRLARFGAMKRRYRVEFQEDQPVIEADGTKRTTELLTTHIDFERGDSLSHSEIMEHDGPILAPVATRTKGTHMILGEVGREDAVMLSPELAHLFTIEELRK